MFVGSYSARPAALKRVQMIGALMWVVYGLLIGATPVVAANLLVFSAAAWTLRPNTGVVEPARLASKPSERSIGT